MIKISSSRTNTVTQEVVQQRPEIDHLGYLIQDRETLIAFHLNSLPTHFNILSRKPQYDTRIAKTNSLLNFHSSHRIKDIQLNHFQLHHTLKSITENVLLYTSYMSVNSWNMLTNEKIYFTSMPLCENLALDKSQNLLAASIERNKWCLYSLKDKKFHIRKSYTDLVNCSCFSSSQTVAIGGNFTELNLIDVETSAERQKVITLGYVNSIDFSEGHQLYALAMDHTAVQLIDPRDKYRTGFLSGHLDYNFAVKFLNGWRIATGGQDASTRIWDLRKGNTELNLLPARSFAVYGLEFNARDDVLYAIELYGYLHAYSLKKPEIVEQSYSYPSTLTGIALSPSMNRLFLSVMHTQIVPFNGILVFDTQTPSLARSNFEFA